MNINLGPLVGHRITYAHQDEDGSVRLHLTGGFIVTIPQARELTVGWRPNGGHGRQ